MMMQGVIDSTSQELQHLEAQLSAARMQAESQLLELGDMDAALAASRTQAEELQQQLAAASAALEDGQSKHSQLQGRHDALQAQWRTGQEQLEDARARIERLEKQLALREAELQAEQARLLHHLQGTAKEHDQATQMSQHIKAADDAVITAQRHSITHLTAQLDEDRQVGASSVAGGGRHSQASGLVIMQPKNMHCGTHVPGPHVAMCQAARCRCFALWLRHNAIPCLDAAGHMVRTARMTCMCRKAMEHMRAHLQDMLQQELKQRKAAESEAVAQRKRVLELEAGAISAQAGLQKQAGPHTGPWQAGTQLTCPAAHVWCAAHRRAYFCAGACARAHAHTHTHTHTEHSTAHSFGCTSASQHARRGCAGCRERWRSVHPAKPPEFVGRPGKENARADRFAPARASRQTGACVR